MPIIEIAIGEYFDRLTILEIKKSKLFDANQIENVSDEIASMKKSFDFSNLSPKAAELLEKINEINLEIWNEMDRIYQIKEPNMAYAELSFRITWLNQQRAFTKREIDTEFGSKFSEEKSFFNS